MRRYFSLIILLFAIKFSFAQELTAVQKVPAEVLAGTNYVAEITIKKGDMNGYIKFSQRIPGSFTASEGDSKGGAFSFKDSIVKIVWIFPPTENEFTISYKVNVSKEATGINTIRGKVYYFRNTHKENFRLDSVNITVRNKNVQSPAVVDTGKTDKALLTTNNSEKQIGQSAEKLSDSTFQITKSIARDTTTLASSSSKTNRNSLPIKDTVSESTSESKPFFTPTTKTITLTKAETATSTLSTKDTVVKTTEAITTAAPKSNDTGTSKPIAVTVIHKPTDSLLTRINATLPPAPTANTSDKTPGNEVRSANAKKYRVQIGAFKTKQKMTGVVEMTTLVTDEGVTKYFTGNFNTHEEAAARRKEMIAKGFAGAFIVAFENEKPVK